jgi:hypothetical protein
MLIATQPMENGLGKMVYCEAWDMSIGCFDMTCAIFLYITCWKVNMWLQSMDTVSTATFRELQYAR